MFKPNFYFFNVILNIDIKKAIFIIIEVTVFEKLESWSYYFFQVFLSTSAYQQRLFLFIN